MKLGDNMEEVVELQEQVKLLEERVYVLERQEATRKVKSWVKILFKLLIILAIMQIFLFLILNIFLKFIEELLILKVKFGK